MKTSLVLLCSVVAGPAFAGAMGPINTESQNSTYVTIGGGYYGGNYQSNYIHYSNGALTTQESFNDSNSNGYAQLGLGASAQIGSLMFDHQVSITKLGGSDSFVTPGSIWKFGQSVDFGYDLMPKINLLQKLDAYGILGAHYGRFNYKKDASVSTEYNNFYDQIGFNLGAGLSYRVSPAFVVGVKYQHWQYKSIQVNGVNPAGTSIDIEQITPGFNLAGVELRYFIN